MIVKNIICQKLSTCLLKGGKSSRLTLHDCRCNSIKGGEKGNSKAQCTSKWINDVAKDEKDTTNIEETNHYGDKFGSSGIGKGGKGKNADGMQNKLEIVHYCSQSF